MSCPVLLLMTFATLLPSCIHTSEEQSAAESLGQVVAMMENLLEEYDNQDQHLHRIQSKLSYLKYGYNSLKHRLSTVECTMSERLGVTSNAEMCLETLKTDTETKLCGIQTCLDDTQPKLDFLKDLRHPCGEGSWRLVVKEKYLNGDPCPNNWMAVTMNGRRFCGRSSATGTTAICDSTTFDTGGEYRRVCGRVIGYADGQSTGFNSTLNIDDVYVDGVSVTHGTVTLIRDHIWTFAAGLTSELSGLSATQLNQVCPCVETATSSAPAFVGNDYFCESGLKVAVAGQSGPILDNPLWDGRDCPTNSQCCEPPFFIKSVTPALSPLEVRLCNTLDTQVTPMLKNLLIEELEFYVE